MRQVSVGAYTSTLSTPNWNIKENVQMLSDEDLGLHCHLNTPWSRNTVEAEKFYFWPFKNGKFDLASGNVNQAWCDHVSELIDACARKKVLLHFTLYDQYANHKLLGKSLIAPGKTRLTPFKDNNVRVLTAKQLYESWDRKNVQGMSDPQRISHFAWLAWYYQDSAAISSYNLTPMGQAIAHQLRFIFGEMAHARQTFPVKSRFAYTLFNEEFLANDPITGKANEIFGGESKIKNWVRWYAEQQGIEFGQRMIEYRNFLNFDTAEKGNLIDDATGKSNILFSAMKRSYSYMLATGARHEIHSINSTKEVDLFVKQGWNVAKTLFSRDGTPDNQKGVKEILAALKSHGNFHFEPKLGTMTPGAWSPTDMDGNFKRILPEIVKEVR